MFSFERFDVLTFDCYGTLIDWERGILDALRPVLDRHRVACADEELLRLYATAESEAEAAGYVPYRDILDRVLARVAERLGFEPTPEETGCLAASIRNWPPFPDTVDALCRLKQRFRLGIISNIDEDLFRGSAEQLQIEFTGVITAEQVRSYKPATAHFSRALQTLGAPREAILHVAQSLYHDIEPARRLGLATVWVNRRHDRPGFGATPPSDARGDLEVSDLRSLAEQAVPSPRS